MSNNSREVSCVGTSTLVESSDISLESKRMTKNIETTSTIEPSSTQVGGTQPTSNEEHLSSNVIIAQDSNKFEMKVSTPNLVEPVEADSTDIQEVKPNKSDFAHDGKPISLSSSEITPTLINSELANPTILYEKLGESLIPQVTAESLPIDMTSSSFLELRTLIGNIVRSLGNNVENTKVESFASASTIEALVQSLALFQTEVSSKNEVYTLYK